MAAPESQPPRYPVSLAPRRVLEPERPALEFPSARRSALDSTLPLAAVRLVRLECVEYRRGPNPQRDRNSIPGHWYPAARSLRVGRCGNVNANRTPLQGDSGVRMFQATDAELLA